MNERTNEALLVGKIKKLLDAGFPVVEISKFLDTDIETIEKYKAMINTAKK